MMANALMDEHHRQRTRLWPEREQNAERHGEGAARDQHPLAGELLAQLRLPASDEREWIIVRKACQVGFFSGLLATSFMEPGGCVFRRRGNACAVSLMRSEQIGEALSELPALWMSKAWLHN